MLMRLFILACLGVSGHPAWAEIVLAARNIRAQEIIRPGDVVLGRGTAAGAFDTVEVLHGQEARVVLYAGRPVVRGDVGPPAIVERNQIVQMQFAEGMLKIATEGRAMERAGAGEMIRVMNLSSHTTVSGLVLANGSVRVVE